MEVSIEKLPRPSAPKGKRRYEVTVNFPNDLKSNIFSKFEIDEKYKLHGVLGGGSNGLVCWGTDKTNGENVAIKKLDNIFRHQAFTDRVMREVLIHSQINHPFIVAFKEIMRPVNKDTFDDIYIVMEMMNGNLDQSIRSAAPLNVKLIMNEILRAFQYLHAANVLHRDLKPDNILIQENQTGKLCDFGLARIRGPGMTETVIAKPYRPPELFLTDLGNQSNYGPAVDIWSLGCVFADMLLRRPYSLGFSGCNTDIDNLKKIAEIIPPPNDDDLSEMIEDEMARLFVKTRLPLTPSRPLNDIFVDVADKSAVDLLERMLVFNPRKRISMADALQHEYMAEITVDVLARELNLMPYEVEKLKDLNPPRIEMFAESPSQTSKKDLRKILFESCVKSQAARTMSNISIM